MVDATAGDDFADVLRGVPKGTRAGAMVAAVAAKERCRAASSLANEPESTMVEAIITHHGDDGENDAPLWNPD